MTLSPLKPAVLCTACNPRKFKFGSTNDLELLEGPIGQDRALDALNLGLRIASSGYNIIAFGDPGTGKFDAVKAFIETEARGRPVADDWAYVNDFKNLNKPKTLCFPAGTGKRFRDDMAQLIEEIRASIPAAFQREDYQTRRSEIEQELQDRQEQAIDAIRQRAESNNLLLLQTPAGFAFVPKDRRGQALNPTQFHELPTEEKERFEKAIAELEEDLQKALRQFPLWFRETQHKIKALNDSIAEYALAHLISSLKEKYSEIPKAGEFLDSVKSDVLMHIDRIIQASTKPVLDPGSDEDDDIFDRYGVNLIIDNSNQASAPVIFEDLPNHSNLSGRVEYQSRFGTLVTDFRYIRPGALHRANGGFLILDVTKLLTHPHAWETLKRTLRSGLIRIESLEKSLGLISTVTLEPEPIPLTTKIILIGPRYLYYLIQNLDEDAQDLFKIGADFDDRIERTDEAEQLYARLFGTISKTQGLRPLDPYGVASLVEHCARLSGDGSKLTSAMEPIKEVIIEADHLMSKDAATLDGDAIRNAIAQKIRRSDRVRDRLYDQIRNGAILMDISGSTVGQANGLSVLQLGDFAFGQPSRITATTRLGDGRVLDIERETRLGGPIHSKGVLILSSYLASRFSQEQPLSMRASLVFEQSYGKVEGDSASLAELCALLSSLADVPIKQSIALTGSVNQLGKVQAIGGVNEKIEGFFDVCNLLESTANNAVIIPQSNVKDLMLRFEVREAVEAGRFQIYAVADVDEAMEILTGEEMGQRDEQSQFPPDTINAKVEQRLMEYSRARRKFAKSEDKSENSDGDA
jgi:predicted ATP-dependent protease